MEQIFYENHMELNMLTDFKKEYLREMGKTPMVDIIKLRHFKKVHDQNTRACIPKHLTLWSNRNNQLYDKCILFEYLIIVDLHQ